MHHLGLTRSVSRRDYLLQTPDSFVRTPSPMVKKGQLVVHIAPQLGARFAMSTVELEPGGVLQGWPAQCFLYVLSGRVRVVQAAGEQSRELGEGGFALLPCRSLDKVEAVAGAQLLLFEKPYQELPGQDAPAALLGTETAVPSAPLNGDPDLQVRCLLPSDQAVFDFAVNTMQYAPGASLAQVEIHYMEHGLLMLEGAGIYRLGEDWHPVQAGDVIWMGAYCPQWFTAVGKVPAKYILYKDFHRHVLA